METANTYQSRVSAKGWVVIPAALRRRYGLVPGVVVNIEDMGDRIVISLKQKGIYKQARGMLPAQPLLTEELVAEHAEELEREKAPVCVR